MWGRGWRAAGRGPADGSRDDRRDFRAAELLDRSPQNGGAANRTCRAAPAALTAIRIGRGDSVDVHEPGPERRLVRFARRGGESEQCAAVVAGPQGDDLVLVGPAALDPVLARQLQRS